MMLKKIQRICLPFYKSTENAIIRKILNLTANCQPQAKTHVIFPDRGDTVVDSKNQNHKSSPDDGRATGLRVAEKWMVLKAKNKELMMPIPTPRREWVPDYRD